MPRKITTCAIDAFLKGQPFRRQNMDVVVRPYQAEREDSVILLLHGNLIARYSVAGRDLYVCDGNHQSNPTKDRLNGLPGVSVNQKDFTWYLNGTEWDGSWAHVGRV
jgi:hypothetical protein